MTNVLKKLKLVPTLVCIIAALISIIAWQHSTISKTKHKLSQCHVDGKVSADSIEAMGKGYGTTVKQLQSGNKECIKELKGERIRTTKINHKVKDHEKTISRLREKIAASPDGCVNKPIPRELLYDSGQTSLQNY
jgi:hypothetical protein